MNDLATSLTTRQASAVIGAHESSVKRWCDQGALQCELTPGGHRRIDFATLLDFARRVEADSPLLEMGGQEAEVWSASERFRRERESDALVDLSYAWLETGEDPHLNRLLQFLLDQGHDPELLCDLILTPLAHRIGGDWEKGWIGVGDEHRMMQVLLEEVLRMRLRGLSSALRPTAIVGVAEGNLHDFGAQMVRLALEANGWRVVYLGADVPVADVVLQQKRVEADLICLSFTPPQVASDANRVLRALAPHYDGAVPVRVALGGSGVRGARLDDRIYPFTAVHLFDQIEKFAGWAAELRKTLMNGK